MKLITVFTLLILCGSVSSQNLIIPGQTPARPHKMIGERNTIYYDPSNPPQVFKGGVVYKYYIPAELKSKFLFIGFTSNISNGELHNELGNDFISVSGSSYTLPLSNDYIAADIADYIWFKTDSTQRSVSTSELIGYDFNRTFIKYDDTSPYQIRIIGILKAGVTLSHSDSIDIYRYFKLPIFHSGYFNQYGYLKDNRSYDRNRWIYYPAVLDDGNTFGLYLASDINTITQDDTGKVSVWKDKLNTGHDFVSGSAYFNDNEISFNGVNEYLKINATTLNQPIYVYCLFKQISWTNGEAIMDGNTNGSAPYIVQTSSTPYTIKVYAGTYSSSGRTSLQNQYVVLRALFNGASSKFTIDNTAFNTGNYGANNAGGLTIGCNANLIGYFANIAFKAIIIRTKSDTSTDESIIYNYLKTIE